jgi:hypothetical protein
VAAFPATDAAAFDAAPLHRAGTAGRRALHLSASLLLGGALLTVVAGAFHPDREPANQHAAVFVEYAASSSWTLMHLGQFAAMGVTVAGLLALFEEVRAELTARRRESQAVA